MGKIAHEADCKAIVGDSNNDRVHEVCLKVGASCISHKYEYQL